MPTVARNIDGVRPLHTMLWIMALMPRMIQATAKTATTPAVTPLTLTCILGDAHIIWHGSEKTTMPSDKQWRTLELTLAGVSALAAMTSAIAAVMLARRVPETVVRLETAVHRASAQLHADAAAAATALRNRAAEGRAEGGGCACRR